jgi:hypothetical protein
VLALTLALQRFETVSRRYVEVRQRSRGMQKQELPPRDPFESPVPWDVAVVEKSLGGIGPERPDHALSVSFNDKRDNAPMPGSGSQRRKEERRGSPPPLRIRNPSFESGTLGKSRFQVLSTREVRDRGLAL